MNKSILTISLTVAIALGISYTTFANTQTGDTVTNTSSAKLESGTKIEDKGTVELKTEAIKVEDAQSSSLQAEATVDPNYKDNLENSGEKVESSASAILSDNTTAADISSQVTIYKEENGKLLYSDDGGNTWKSSNFKKIK